ncbi:hypothetical protein B0H12DRAFT_1186213, partial [Mycena haematopus]
MNEPNFFALEPVLPLLYSLTHMLIFWHPQSSSGPTNLNTSPRGESASFDGFGFDLNWSAMRTGNTRLDMNDVAVTGLASARDSTVYRASRDRRPSQLSLMLRRPSTASGGSVMHDPDTFNAAVRAWGGDEYERQRKYWTFRRDHGRGQTSKGETGGGTVLAPVRSITGGRLVLERAPSMLSGHEKEKQARPVHVQWRGMALNAEEIWNSSLVGSFKVRRIELRPQKPQQRVIIDPFRGPYTLGPKPPHDGAYTNIHKHSKVTAFSIHRHYKPTRAPQPHDAQGSFSITPSTTGGSVSTASGRPGYANAMEERRRPTPMLLLAPRHVQEAYTSTTTAKGLRSHGLLDEKRDQERERERSDNKDTRSTRSEKGREKDKDKDKHKDKSGKGSSRQTSSTARVASTYRNEIVAPPVAEPSTHTYPPPLSRVLRRASAHATPVASHQVYIPPWVTLGSRVKQVERRRR